MSYSCTENIGQILQKHNKKLLSTKKPTGPQQSDNLCNCRVKANCPVDNKCLTESVIYKATLSSTTGEKCEYVGLTDCAFKTRYNLHTSTFRNENKRAATTLASHVWDKGLNPTPNIHWQILKKCERYAPGQKTCQLCLCEKLFIVKNLNNPQSLNKRADIGNKCTLHKRKHFLNYVT